MWIYVIWASEILNLRPKNVAVLFEVNENFKNVRHNYHLCSS